MPLAPASLVRSCLHVTVSSDMIPTGTWGPGGQHRCSQVAPLTLPLTALLLPLPALECPSPSAQDSMPCHFLWKSVNSFKAQSEGCLPRDPPPLPH